MPPEASLFAALAGLPISLSRTHTIRMQHARLALSHPSMSNESHRFFAISSAMEPTLLLQAPSSTTPPSRTPLVVDGSVETSCNALSIATDIKNATRPAIIYAHAISTHTIRKVQVRVQSKRMQASARCNCEGRASMNQESAKTIIPTTPGTHHFVRRKGACSNTCCRPAFGRCHPMHFNL
jgi:hypothetical protein